MKEATGETNMTIVTIVVIAAALAIISAILPGIINSIGDKWNDETGVSSNDIVE